MSKLFAIAYASDEEWIAGAGLYPKYQAVAVAADTLKLAIKRLKENRPARVLWSCEMPRGPEYPGSWRIEGTIDLMDLRKPTPSAGSPAAERMRKSNQEILAKLIVAEAA